MSASKETTPAAAAVRTWRRLVIAVGLLVPLVWSIGFLRFVDAVATREPLDVGAADAIVVLTGGAQRVAKGVQLLMRGKAEKLLVSGANSDVRRQDIQSLTAEAGLAVPPELLNCCVDLGFKAKDTHGNARETAEWAKQRGVRSLIVVTSNYHMARSRFELARTMPGVMIRGYPVVADTLKLDRWWLWPGSLKLLWLEYHKFILAGLRGIVG